mgnify:CR=1 FL=1
MFFVPGRACFLFMATFWATCTLDLPWSSTFCPPWRPWGRSELQNATKTIGFSTISKSPKGPPETSRGPPIAPAKQPQAQPWNAKDAPRDPTGPQGPPKGPPRSAKGPPRNPPPQDPQGTSKTVQGAPCSRFWNNQTVIHDAGRRNARSD